LETSSIRFSELIAPLLFVVGAIYLLGPLLPLRRTWARVVVFVSVWAVVLRYLDWRLFTTVLPATGGWYELAWIWFCLSIEVLALCDAFVLYLCFLKTSDRHAEADIHETRLRAFDKTGMPSVDVYIPTYDEPIEVLEKTIVGALCIDYPNCSIWVLDDGRRAWLKQLCEAKGVGYLTRSDNEHAKAGNINHALTKTDAEFVAVFDADFVPQRNFLMRTIGFFFDPQIAVVQVPHAFYNHDPMQASLALRETLPDDQRFFFEAIMPSRDGWNAAFCCGSNSVTRRAALREIGDALPTESITEDMLLTLTLLRRGYVTRYLCEHLAYGLAPEGLDAFFVQRRRWARGAIQMLFLANGPLGRNLTIMQRLLFLPTHWISQSLMFILAIVAPLVFLWTGILPFTNVTTEAVFYYLVPMILAMVGGIWVYAPKQYFPFAAQVIGTFQALKIVPTVLATLVKPFGHVFKVTPKGGEAMKTDFDHSIFWIAATLIALTMLGLVVNTMPDWRIINASGLTAVAIWCGLNCVVLFLVCMMSLQAPFRRQEERFDLDEPISVFSAAGELSTGQISDISLSGVGVVADAARALTVQTGDSIRVFIAEVGFVAGSVVRQKGQFIGVQFDLPPGVERDLLIRKLFTAGFDTTKVEASAWSATGAVLGSIWTTGTTKPRLRSANIPMPPVERKLPAQSLVIRPRFLRTSLAELGEKRRRSAA
jgi:cellulose synthase (UDP-forming)